MHLVSAGPPEPHFGPDFAKIGKKPSPSMQLDRSGWRYSIWGIVPLASEKYFSGYKPGSESLRGAGENQRREGQMAKGSLRELYIDELRDLYNAETQLTKALPKMAKASTNTELREAFEEHLRQTAEQVSRLEQIFDMLEEKPTGKKCLGMEGLVKEGAETMREEYEDAVMDASIIGTAQRVEHYEISAYGTAREYARLLGEDEHVSLLEQTLAEEKETDQKLTQLAEEINPRAQEVIGSGSGEEQQGNGQEGKKRGKSTSPHAA